MINRDLVSILRNSLKSGSYLGPGLKVENWGDLYLLCQKHAIVGVVFESIKNCEKEDLNVPQNILYEWIGIREQIVQQNKYLNQKCLDLVGKLKEAGFRSCILKGQGNALIYPNPYIRTSGDIDVWVDAIDEEIIQWVKKDYPEACYNYIHVDFLWDKATPVELHYRCSYLFNRKSNALFQTWIESMKEEQFSHYVLLPNISEKVCIPTEEFNLIFQLSHMLRHFLGNGVGLRHLIDYFYLLRKGVSEKEKRVFAGLVHKFGIYQFAAAVMYVEKEVLGLEEEYLLLPIDKRRGNILLKHIMSDGNFGHQGDKSYLYSKNPVLRNVAKLYRLITLVYVCPKETIGKLIYGKPKYRNSRIYP